MTQADWIQVRGLTKIYGTGAAAVRAVDQVSLDIARGEFLALIGVSGSGKSTLLQLLGCLDTPTEGEIYFDGRELGSLRPFDRALFRRHQVGFVFQAFHLAAHRTAVENVELALTIQGLPRGERRGLAMQALAQMDMHRRADHRPSELSGGEQQRVALARATVHRPPLLLADEPTGNLDRRHAQDVLDLLTRINAENGTTVILVTHDEAAATRVSQRVLRMEDGRLVTQSGPAYEPDRAKQNEGQDG